METKNALDVLLKGTDIGDVTVKDYLRQLLERLWAEEEGFSGKRPFGNSGWQNDVILPLVEAGYITGWVERDPDEGYVDDYEFPFDEAEVFMEELIEEVFK